jgi:hypothetical protein
MAISKQSAGNQVSGQYSETLTDAERLKQDYEQRLADKRPISHSVAVAYRQLIARCEQQHRENR